MDSDTSTTERVNTSLTANLCSINICGLSERSRFCLDKYCEERKLDILAVQESGTRCNDNLQISNMGYMLDSNGSRNKGCALFINKKHTYKQLTNLPLKSDNFDYIWALVAMHGKRYIIGTAYVKTDNDDLIASMVDMVNHMYDNEVKRHKAAGIILMGDFNARHVAWGDKQISKNGERLAKDTDTMKFTIHAPNSPSFLGINGNSIIDMFISSNNLSDSLSNCKTDETAILYSGAPIRGHVPIHIKMAIAHPIKKTEVTEKIDLRSIDWDKWGTELEEAIYIASKGVLLNQEDPKAYWHHLKECFDRATNNNSKKKRSCVHSKPYWTNELSVLSKKYRTAQRCWNKMNTDINKRNLEDAKEEFDAKRKEECREFILKNTKGLNTAETREFWKNFKKLFGKQKDSKIEMLANESDDMITDEQEKEILMFSTFFEGQHLHKENFDEHFHDTITKQYFDAKSKGFYVQNLDRSIRNNPVRGEDSNIHLNFNDDIGEDEIRYILKNKISKGKSFDQEDIHPIMLKHLGPNTIKALARLYNLCLSSSVWVWDTADVIFLKKEGKPSYNDVGAYRPISITSYLGKILEKILVQRFEAYLNGEGLIDSSQEGFAKGRNTVRYLNRLTINIKKDLEKKLTVACLFLDFEKAFDSVWKKGLIVKLIDNGINGKFLALIDSFLMNRKVRLHINNYVGTLRHCLEVGLPQGSVLSPILFKFYIMDLGEELVRNRQVDVYKFADDGTFKVIGTHWNECKVNMENVLLSLCNWCNKWRLVMNCKIDKTEIVIFTGKNNADSALPSSITVNSKNIRIVEKSKVLGLIIDNKLNFKDHSEMVLKQLNARWAMICKFSNRNWGFNQKVVVRLIKALFLSKLYYAGHVWICASNTKDIEKLWYKMIKSAIGAVFNIQKSLAEAILGLPPLLLLSDIYRMKHYLKINIMKTIGDQLRSDLADGLETSTILRTELNGVFKFLTWKLGKFPEQFTDSDCNIITSKDHANFTTISSKACMYSKNLINVYTESLWQAKVNNEYLSEGYTNIPKVSCSNIPIPNLAERDLETIVMSHFYDNNLMNGFLYRISHKNVTSPLCSCTKDVQTPYHCLMKCDRVDQGIQRKLVDGASSFYIKGNNRYELMEKDHIILLNMSRNKDILELMFKAIRSNIESYRKTIVLNKTKSTIESTIKDKENIDYLDDF